MHRVTEDSHHREQHNIGVDHRVAAQLARAEPAVFAAAGHNHTATGHNNDAAGHDDSAADDKRAGARGTTAAFVLGFEPAAADHHRSQADDDLSDDDVAGRSQRGFVHRWDHS